MTVDAPDRRAEPPATGAPSALERWGRAMARRRRQVLIAWPVLMAVAGLLYPVLGTRLGAPDYTVRDSESARAQAVLTRHFPELGAEQDVVVFRSAAHGVDAPGYRNVVDRVLAALRTAPGVTAVHSPYDDPELVAADRRTAVAPIGLRGTEAERAELARELQETVTAESAGSGVAAYLTGPSPLTNDLSDLELRDQRTAETFGVALAFLVLFLALGAVVAALLPIAVALGAVLLCMAALVPLALPLHLDRFVTVVATVIGIGVGIDYALFMVGRFRDELARRRSPDGGADREAIEAAVGAAVRTSGRTLLASGLIVIVALGSMLIINGHIFMEIALATSLVVAGCLLTALVPLPAMLAVLGDRVNTGALPRALRPFGSRTGGPLDVERSRWTRWAEFVLRRPVMLGLPALALLVTAGLPAAATTLGVDWGLSALAGTPSGKGQRIVAGSFAPGAVAPVQVVVCDRRRPLGDAVLDAVSKLTGSVARDGRVRKVASVRSGGDARPAVVDRSGRCAYIAVILGQAVDSPASAGLVRDLRERTVPEAFRGTGAEVHVGGLTAQHVDLADEINAKLPLVVALVLGLSFCHLMLAFRSLLIPAKAVLLNVLATVAALGLTVFVFQFGHGERLLGFTSSGTVQAHLPVALFALLFGLSMDYEIFLISRLQEERLRLGDDGRAVALAVGRTASQISAAAAIMAAVFGSLLLADVLELKQFAFGLAVAVLIDATVIRLLLVPAVMGIAKQANWWLPGRLRRLLPPAHRAGDSTAGE